MPEDAVSQDSNNQGKLSLTERRKQVALGVQAGKSNRAIANELGVDEGTVRRDRKSLPPPIKQAPVKTQPTKVMKVRSLPRKPTGPSPSELQLTKMLDIVKVWIKEQKLIVLDNLEYVLDKAEKLLCLGQDLIKNYPAPAKDPAEFLRESKPKYAVEDHMPAKMEFCGDWLALWVARSLPGDFRLQQDFLLRARLQSRS